MRKKSLISLFSGAGGLDRGLSEAGFSVKLSVELDEDARSTLLKNNPKSKLAMPGDIHQLEPIEVLRQSNLKEGELDLLAGGPPCQPFSKSGYWVTGDTNRLTDPRAKTLKAYLDIVRVALPKAILLENVKGIAYSAKNEGLMLLLSELDKINKAKNTDYQPQVITLNAADYGVPQLRERVFIIASRDGSAFKMPPPTHQPKSRGKKGDLLHVSAWEAIGDLDVDIWPRELNLTGKWARLLPSIPEGNNYQWHTDRMGGQPIFGWRSRFWSFLLKLAKDQPAWTIQAQPGPATGPFHWKNRLLSTRELARLQTFPDDFSFVGNRRSVQKQIGNAVPPAIGELLGLEIRRQFFSERVRKRVRLILRTQSGLVPKSEVPTEVPCEYHRLIGSYQSHPGTGKGPSAMKRKA